MPQAPRGISYLVTSNREEGGSYPLGGAVRDVFENDMILVPSDPVPFLPI